MLSSSDPSSTCKMRNADSVRVTFAVSAYRACVRTHVHHCLSPASGTQDLQRNMANQWNLGKKKKKMVQLRSNFFSAQNATCQANQHWLSLVTTTPLLCYKYVCQHVPNSCYVVRPTAARDALFSDPDKIREAVNW